MRKLFCIGMCLMLAACGDSVTDIANKARDNKLDAGQRIEFSGSIDSVTQSGGQYALLFFEHDDKYRFSSVMAINNGTTSFKEGDKVKAKCDVMRYEAQEKEALVYADNCSFTKA